MGGLHAGNAAANPRLELAYVADNSIERADALASQLGARAATIEDVIADPEVKGVIVATSTDALLSTSLAFLRAGKAVFSEKPLSLSLETLQASAELADPSMPPLFVAFNRRFDPHLSVLKDRIDQGEIGKVESLHIVNHDPATPPLNFIPRSGGLFRDFTVHDFDTSLWLLDEPVSEVFAWASCLIDPAIGELGDSDTAKLILRTQSGKLCLISNNRRSGYGYDQRTEVFGSKGALRIENINTNAVTRWAEDGAHSAPIHYAFPERYALAYERELDHFADILLKGEKPQTDFRSAMRALRLAEAAVESANTGRSVPVAQEEI